MQLYKVGESVFIIIVCHWFSQSFNVGTDWNVKRLPNFEKGKVDGRERKSCVFPTSTSSSKNRWCSLAPTCRSIFSCSCSTSKVFCSLSDSITLSCCCTAFTDRWSETLCDSSLCWKVVCSSSRTLSSSKHWASFSRFWETLSWLRRLKISCWSVWKQWWEKLVSCELLVRSSQGFKVYVPPRDSKSRRMLRHYFFLAPSSSPRALVQSGQLIPAGCFSPPKAPASDSAREQGHHQWPFLQFWSTLPRRNLLVHSWSTG